jgi:hypothetical protein
MKKLTDDSAKAQFATEMRKLLDDNTFLDLKDEEIEVDQSERNPGDRKSVV